jgi:hypothetical protein
MGEVIPMDSLSRGVKPNENKDIKNRAPGGNLFDEQGNNTPKNIEHPAGGVSRGGPDPSGSKGKLDNFADKLGSSMPEMPEKHQKALQKTLDQLQKAAPVISKKMSGGVFGIASLIKDVMSQIDLARDWIFIPFVASFALLKDILDIALAAIPGVDIVVPFIMSVMLTMLTIVALLITGSDLKNRGLAKYILSMSIGFIAEALPGLDWLPMAFIEVILVYCLTLFDRMMLSFDPKGENKEEGESAQAGNQEAQPQYPDNYPAAEPEKKAA